MNFGQPPAFAEHRLGRLETNVWGNLYRRQCSCGWIGIGTEEEVQNRAATHDLDEPQSWPPAPMLRLVK